MVHVTEDDKRRLRMPWRALLASKGHEFWVKARGKRIDGQGLIGADARVVRDGFGGLTDDAFDRYNLPQVWVERRQLPRVLHERVPKAHARVLDLGCGPGYSTEILCYFADPSWRIVGLDLIEHNIARARARANVGRYVNAHGQRITPTFVCQSITDRLMDGHGAVADASIDLAVSGGVVGLYLHPPQAKSLLAELRRVVKPRGHIALDAGPSIPVSELRELCELAGFVHMQTVGCVPFDPRPKLVFRKA